MGPTELPHSKTLEYISTAHLHTQTSPSYLTNREVRPRNRSVLLVGSRLNFLPPHSPPGLRPLTPTGPATMVAGVVIVESPSYALVHCHSNSGTRLYRHTRKLFSRPFHRQKRLWYKAFKGASFVDLLFFSWRLYIACCSRLLIC